MTHNTAKSFWSTYIGMICRDDAGFSMINPAVSFTEQTRAGGFDSLSDEEYQSKLDEVTELSSFWDGTHSDSVGNILLNAIARTSMSDSEIDKITTILADASANTVYGAPEPDGQECNESILSPDMSFPSVDDDHAPFEASSGWTPRSIYNYLNQHIYGQEAAKKAVSMLMYHHLNGRGRNIVMAGVSGCGKTEIWRALSKVFGCIRIVNGPQLSCDGWKGSCHVKDIFMDEPENMAGHLVIVIDEADKLFEPTIVSGGTDMARKIQDELLKLMDGDTLTFRNEEYKKHKKVTVDCSGVSVVLCGSFERMLEKKTESSGSIGFCRQGRKESSVAECTEEDLIQYANVRREIAGRISRIVTLKALDAEDFENIMESPVSPIHKIEKAHHVSLSVNEQTRKKLASDAAKSGLGCRYIRSMLQNILDEQMFDAPDAKEYELRCE